MAYAQSGGQLNKTSKKLVCAGTSELQGWGVGGAPREGEDGYLKENVKRQ